MIRDFALHLLTMAALAAVVAFPMLPHAELVRSSPGIPRSILADHMRQCEDCRCEDKIRCLDALEIVDRTMPVAGAGI